MKGFKIALFTAAVVLILVLSAVRSGKEGDAALRYDPAKETSVTGTIAEVQEFFCPVSNDRGVHLMVTTNDGPVLVHVAVARELRERNARFNAGERVEVVGASIRYRGDNSIIAREITRGNEVFILRDAKGEMLWR